MCLHSVATRWLVTSLYLCFALPSRSSKSWVPQADSHIVSNLTTSSATVQQAEMRYRYLATTWQKTYKVIPHGCAKISRWLQRRSQDASIYTSPRSMQWCVHWNSEHGSTAIPCEVEEFSVFDSVDLALRQAGWCHVLACVHQWYRTTPASLNSSHSMCTAGLTYKVS